MKKLLFLAASAIMMVTASCTKNTQITNDSYYYTMLTDMEVSDYESSKIISYEFEYVQYDSKGNMSEIENAYAESVPVLHKVYVKGDTITEITYEYVEEMTVLNVTVESDSGETTESFLLNVEGLAIKKFVNGNFEFHDNLTFDELDYRATYEDLTITSSLGNYLSYENGEGATTEFKYSTLSNLFTLQQYSIPGVPFYLNITGHFGGQSRNLLSYATTTEDEESVEYAYSYDYNQYGLIGAELIAKDDQKLQLTTYGYGTVEVKNEEEESDDYVSMW